MEVRIKNPLMSISGGSQNQCQTPSIGSTRKANAPDTPPMKGMTDMEMPRFATLIMQQTCPQVQNRQVKAHGMARHQRMIIHAEIIGKVLVYTGCEKAPLGMELSHADAGHILGHMVMFKSKSSVLPK